MPQKIEDYALLGDLQTAALVGRDGSVDWLCFPRFDSPACFAALLGTPDHGRWKVAPKGGVKATRRRYLGDTLVLETEFEADGGVVAVTDFMPIRGVAPDLVRIVDGREGEVTVRSELAIRFDYGETVPWVQKHPGGNDAVAGPNALRLRTPVGTHGEGFTTVSEFTVRKGERVPFALTWFRSYEREPAELDAEKALTDTLAWWEQWAAKCTYDGDRRDLVVRSLVTLKAMTYRPSGGIVAAPTTSLPEQLGGVRNWDYRYCWLRDATLTLLALLNCGYKDEAKEWEEWLLRAVAGDPSQIQIMYGVGGERRLDEWEVPHLPGYEGAKPVRVGNAASNQFQLDVYGEVAAALHQARVSGLKPPPAGWGVCRALVNFVADHWADPDEGIWEVRGPRRHFTHSKVMAWVALDRAVKSAERWGLKGPVGKWRQARDAVRARVLQDGYSDRLNAFTQSFGADLLDASLLLVPTVGFLPADDPRVRGTVAAVEQHLLRDGFVMRYDTGKSDDGLPPGEGAFLPCTFWLADAHAQLGERDKARSLFDRLCGLCNDVGLLAEEYDPRAGRLGGNFPQAFSHLALVNTAMTLSRPADSPTHQRKHS
jgi:GH15 family glucan-1,4-alpha-glucosidase